MAKVEQTNLLASMSTPAKTVINIITYVFCVIKLYLIGAVALLYQLLEKSAPVKGMHYKKPRFSRVDIYARTWPKST